MAFTRAWDVADPADGDLAANGAQEIRQFKADVEERLENWLATPMGRTIDSDNNLAVHFGGARDSCRGLTLRTHANNATYQLSLAANELVLKDANSVPAIVLNANIVLDITTSGANGLDTGNEAANTWYHAWVAAKVDGNVAGLLSTNAVAPTLPANYVFYGRFGAVYNLVSNFSAFHQVDHRVHTYTSAALTGGNATSATSVSLASKVPSTAKAVDLECYLMAANATSIQGYVSPTNDGILLRVIYLAGANASGMGVVVPMMLPLVTAQTVYYWVSASNHSMQLTVRGWEY